MHQHCDKDLFIKPSVFIPITLEHFRYRSHYHSLIPAIGVLFIWNLQCLLKLHKIPQFHIISLCRNFVERRSFHTRELGEITVFFAVIILELALIFSDAILTDFIVGMWCCELTFLVLFHIFVLVFFETRSFRRVLGKSREAMPKLRFHKISTPGN